MDLNKLPPSVGLCLALSACHPAHIIHLLFAPYFLITFLMHGPQCSLSPEYISRRSARRAAREWSVCQLRPPSVLPRHRPFQPATVLARCRGHGLPASRTLGLVPRASRPTPPLRHQQECHLPEKTPAARVSANNRQGRCRRPSTRGGHTTRPSTFPVGCRLRRGFR